MRAPTPEQANITQFDCRWYAVTLGFNKCNPHIAMVGSTESSHYCHPTNDDVFKTIKDRMIEVSCVDNVDDIG